MADSPYLAHIGWPYAVKALRGSKVGDQINPVILKRQMLQAAIGPADRQNLLNGAAAAAMKQLVERGFISSTMLQIGGRSRPIFVLAKLPV